MMGDDTIAMTGLEMVCQRRWGRFNTQGLYTADGMLVGEIWGAPWDSHDDEMTVAFYGGAIWTLLTARHISQS